MADSISDRDRKIFPFFELPRELRDFIYEQSLQSKDQRLRCGICLKAKDTSPTNVPLVSKQVKRELEECAHRRSHLTIADRLGFDEHTGIITLPPAAKKIWTLSVEACPEDPKEMGLSLRWIRHVTAQMFSLISLSVKVVAEIEVETTVEEWVEGLEISNHTTLPKLQAVQILHASQDLYNECWYDELVVAMVAEWTKGNVAFARLAEPRDMLLEEMAYGDGN